MQKSKVPRMMMEMSKLMGIIEGEMRGRWAMETGGLVGVGEGTGDGDGDGMRTEVGNGDGVGVGKTIS
jgi:hypothetical protein